MFTTSKCSLLLPIFNSVVATYKYILSLLPFFFILSLAQILRTISIEIMEETNPNNPTEDHHRKHLALLTRLSNRPTTQSQSKPESESLSSFLSLFSESKQSIHSDLTRLLSLNPKPEPATAKPELDKISFSISNLEQTLAQNSYFLPSYELRAALKSISDLKEALEKASAQLIPRKKFSFRNKAASKKDPTELFKKSEERSDSGVQGLEKKDSPGFRNKNGEILVKDFRNMDSNGEFTLSDLNECEVYLKGKIRALFFNRIYNCKIFCGPVFGSILIEDVKGCIFMLASHQMRIHEAKGSDFYLRVRSRPIIEDCSNVRFGDYRLKYDGIEEDLLASGLMEETDSWKNVDDFKWLRAVQSPNWCLIPEDEMLEIIDASKFEESCDS